jgi:tetratricopeptide (TPR) repeat protein
VSTLPITDISQAIPHPAEALAATLADSMVSAWARGERTTAEALLAAHPEVADRPEAAVRLIYEEVLLRRDLGDEPGEAELLARFPRWRDELSILLACDRLVRPVDDPDATASWPHPDASEGPWPAVGERLGGFRLLGRLGSGAMGHTFLASDPGLADRPVVLKLTPRGLEEHVSLARLQHTNIVPLYAAPEFPGRDLRALCMPYLGGASLDRVLDDLASHAERRPDGRAIVEAVDRAQGGLPVAVESAGPARRLLAALAYPEAVAWVAACLADALHAAHGRGLVHMDVKPANVLLASDGTPMLLDFHLARPPVVPGGLSTGSIGGTPSTMAPEQRAAMEALAAGRPVPAAIDGRADIYALGRTMDAALDVPGAREMASPGLRAIVGRCVEPDPADRYPDAASLGDDLRRHINNLPLRGAADRSLRERWAKWRRRSPQALPRLALLAVSVGALAGLIVQGQVRHERARADLSGARADLERGRFAEALRLAAVGLDRLGRWPGDPGLRRELAEVRSRAGQATARDALHELANKVRFADRGDASPSSLARLREFRPRLREARALARSLGLVAVPGGIDRQVADDLRDLALLDADLAVALAAGAPGRERARREALAILDEAEALLGPGPALTEARRSHAEALGLKDVAEAAARAAESLPSATASDFYSVGLVRLRAGDRAGAITAFGRALDLEPRGFWPLFDRGIAAYGLGRFEDARADFHACVALAPASADVFYNRALALDALGRPVDALRDLDRALTLEPKLPEAALNAGLIRLRLGRHEEAEASLRRALELGADPALVRYNLALVRLALGDRPGAIAHLQGAGDLEPARRLLNQLGRPAGR